MPCRKQADTEISGTLIRTTIPRENAAADTNLESIGSATECLTAWLSFYTDNGCRRSVEQAK